MAKLLFVLLALPLAAGAANNDDGFVWIDANTKIRLKPIGKSGAGAAAGETKAPEPKKDDKKAKAKK